VENIRARHISKKRINIPATSTVIIDTIPWAKLHLNEYSMSYETIDKTLIQTLKLNLFKDDSECATQVYGIGGGCINTDIDCSINNDDVVELSVTNNEPQTISVCFTKIKT